MYVRGTLSNMHVLYALALPCTQEVDISCVSSSVLPHCHYLRQGLLLKLELVVSADWSSHPGLSLLPPTYPNAVFTDVDMVGGDLNSSFHPCPGDPIHWAVSPALCS